jgi:sigma-B regulation protein RsbU (phosphoserine phosphatase)
MNMASVVQEKLYPQSSPHLERWDVAGAVYPAAILCGDYFDYIPMRDGLLGIAIGDVCGHGLGPALLMSETRAYLRSLAREVTNLGTIVTRVNEILVEDLTDSDFVALLAIRLDPDGHFLQYCNAGHLAGYLLDRSGEIKATLKSTDLPLGLFPRRSYQCSKKIPVDRGDIVALFTDGVTETRAEDDSFFEVNRALEAIRANQHKSSQEIVTCLHAAARDFAGSREQQDDMTIVVCKLR